MGFITRKFILFLQTRGEYQYDRILNKVMWGVNLRGEEIESLRKEPK